MESLRNSFQYQWKLVWRESLWNSFQILKVLSTTMGLCLQRILMEFLTKSMEISLESSFPDGVLKEFPSISMEIALESSWSMFIWNPYGILFLINGNWFGQLLVCFPMDSLRNSGQRQWKFVWRAIHLYEKVSNWGEV